MRRRSSSGLEDAKAEHGIEAYVRFRSCPAPSRCFLVSKSEPNALHIKLPVKPRNRDLNNSKLGYKFNVSGIFQPNSSQDEVFKKVGAEAIKYAING